MKKDARARVLPYAVPFSVYYRMIQRAWLIDLTILFVPSTLKGCLIPHAYMHFMHYPSFSPAALPALLSSLILTVIGGYRGRRLSPPHRAHPSAALPSYPVACKCIFATEGL